MRSFRLSHLTALLVIAVIASGCNLYTWGRNDDGQLGDGTTTQAIIPVNQNTDVAYYTDWVNISTGIDHACGIREAANGAGTLWCWGSAHDGQLATPTPRSVDVTLPRQAGTRSDWASIASGHRHSCAIQLNQSLWCWGSNSLGQLGIGTFDFTQDVPTPVPATSWVAIEAGGDTTCGIQTDQSLWCWGARLGTTNKDRTPVQVGANQSWAHVAVGQTHACAIRNDQTLWCWGASFGGALGDGTGLDQTSPVQEASQSTWIAIEAEASSTCAISTNSQLSCWGANGNGRLGLGDLNNRATPTPVSGGGQWTDVAIINSLMCAVGTDRSLACSGYTTTVNLPGSRSILEPSGNQTWRSIEGSTGNLCGVRTDGVAACAVQTNGSGEGGSGHAGERTLLSEPVGTTADFLTVSAGGSLTCGIRDVIESDTGGTVWCWGGNVEGDDNSQPALVLDRPVYDTVVAGRNYYCATNSIFTTCRGNARIENSALILRMDNLSAGAYHACGTTRLNGLIVADMFCFGANDQGQLGDGTTNDGSVAMTGDWIQVDAGDAHTCATQGDGSLWCWGSNAGGRLGDGTTTQRLSPVQVGTATNWTQVDAGGTHTCAIKTNGQLWCWGTNNRGQLGLADTTNRLSPTRVGTASNWTHVTTGFNFTCGLRTAPIGHDLYCWGANNNGRLGDGTTTQRNTPVEIGAGTNWATVDAGDGHVAATRITD